MAAPMVKTNHPGIYSRGKKFVIVWTHDGRQHKESFRTLQEAKAAQGERRAGETKPKSRVTFAEHFSEWIVAYSGRTKRGFGDETRAEYRRLVETYALPTMGRKRLGDIEPQHVKALYKRLRDQQVPKSVVEGLRAPLSAMFADAVEDGHLRTNPVRGVKVPAAPRSTDEPIKDRPKAPTKAELALLLSVVDERWRLMIEFIAHTGVRISELIGLRWEHLDLGEQPKVMIREQVYEGTRRAPKTEASIRDIPLSPGMRQALLAHRTKTYAGEKTPVFKTSTGRELRSATLYGRVLRPAMIAAGLYDEAPDRNGKVRQRPLYSFHSLRHFCGSALLERGRNLKQVSVWMGHSNMTITANVYMHLLDTGVGDADFFDDVIGPLGGNKVAIEDPGTAANAGETLEAELAI